MTATRRVIMFTVHQEPFGKARVAQGKFGRFADKKTEAIESKILQAYINSGATRWDRDAPLSIQVACSMQRAAGDHRSDGLTLNKAGKLKGLYARKRPDVDNIAKTIMDALNGQAYHDDAQIVHLSIVKKWVNGPGRMTITIEELKDEVLEEARLEAGTAHLRNVRA